MDPLISFTPHFFISFIFLTYIKFPEANSGSDKVSFEYCKHIQGLGAMRVSSNHYDEKYSTLKIQKRSHVSLWFNEPDMKTCKNVTQKKYF